MLVSSRTRRGLVISLAGLAGALTLRPGVAEAASASSITQDSLTALHRLYTDEPHARTLGAKAKAVLVFPQIVKAGFILGGQTGDGALLVNGEPVGFYNISAVSFGLQLGAQAFSYALFFMTDAALAYLKSSQGWAIGSGPSVVVLDKGAAASVTSTTLSQDVYAVPFGQQGLMAGIGIEGSKITHIYPGS
ncbi:MAG TPA: lipid-binding SYLF domain-containing protein [Acetobacteraceae bacterium]|nr:lipid-binding SYLF domain-containing protein [Acetobacteraceae bacterium]